MSTMMTTTERVSAKKTTGTSFYKQNKFNLCKLHSKKLHFSDKFINLHEEYLETETGLKILRKITNEITFNILRNSA